MATILMTESYWRNSHLSIARFYGGCIFNGHEYVIVNKDGKDLFECTHEANKAGREMAIEPWEPADLVRKDFVKIYRKIGREKFIAALRENPHVSEKELKMMMMDDDDN